MVGGARRCPGADQYDPDRQRERGGTRRRAVVRDAAQREPDGLAGRHGSARRGDEHFAVCGNLALLFELRRAQRRRVNFFHHHRELREVRWQLLRDLDRTVGGRQLARHLHERVAGRERPLNRDARAGDARLRR